MIQVAMEFVRGAAIGLGKGECMFFIFCPAWVTVSCSCWVPESVAAASYTSLDNTRWWFSSVASSSRVDLPRLCCTVFRIFWAQ